MTCTANIPANPNATPPRSCVFDNSEAFRVWLSCNDIEWLPDSSGGTILLNTNKEKAEKLVKEFECFRLAFRDKLNTAEAIRTHLLGERTESGHR